MANPLLPRGDEGWISFEVVYLCAEWAIDLETFTHQREGGFTATYGEVYVDVVYGNSLDLQRTRARFHLAKDGPDGAWVPVSIDYYTPPDATSPKPSVRFR